jgi:hypothetical protein
MPDLAASYTGLTTSYKPPTRPTICQHLSPYIPPISDISASTSFFEAFLTVVPKALTTLYLTGMHNLSVANHQHPPHHNYTPITHPWVAENKAVERTSTATPYAGADPRGLITTNVFWFFYQFCLKHF